MTTKTTDTHNTRPADRPLALRLSEGFGHTPGPWVAEEIRKAQLFDARGLRRQ